MCAGLHMYVLYIASRVPWTTKLSSRVIQFQVTYILCLQAVQFSLRLGVLTALHLFKSLNFVHRGLCPPTVCCTVVDVGASMGSVFVQGSCD